MNSLKRLAWYVFLGHFALAAFPASAWAGFVGTHEAVEMELRQDRVAQMQRMLDRDDVRQQLVSLGVDPQHAKARVAALTEAELARFEQELSSGKAGSGVIEVVGIVFVVLLILELVGVTDIFKSI